MKVLGIIPARGGSKGIPRKNIIEVCGKPLIAYTIIEAKKSKYISRLILSSDDQEIISVASSWGCESPFIRPKELARDDTLGIDPVIHAINSLEEKFEYVVLLQPTSPLRVAEDIDRCIDVCIQQNVCSCVSVSLVNKSPYWMFELDNGCHMKPVIPADKSPSTRQSLPPVYVLNGAVYVARCDWLLKQQSFVGKETCAYVMPKQRSLDIDTEDDLFVFKSILSNDRQIK
jgi:N-acylneuraminate cytidylyltransferase